MALLFLCVAALGAAYGVLNIFDPGRALRWQRSATARRTDGDPRREVGQMFQRWMKVDPDAEPDSATLWRMRVLGVVEVIGAVLIALAARNL